MRGRADDLAGSSGQTSCSNNLSDTLTKKTPQVPSRTYFYNLMTWRRGKIPPLPPHSVLLEKKATNFQQSGSCKSYKEIMKRDLNNHDLTKNIQSSVSIPAEGSAQPATTHQDSNRRLSLRPVTKCINTGLALTESYVCNLNYTAYIQEATAVE